MLPLLWTGFLALCLHLLGDPSSPDAKLPLQMSTPRVNCTATETTGGRILITGGLREQTALTSAIDTAELLDPEFDSGKGRVSAPIPLAKKLFAARAFHAAVPLDDGRVLLIGGDLSGSVELFDPTLGVRGEFKAFGLLTHGPRFGITATRLNDGRVLVTGGLFANQKPSLRTDLIDPAAGTIVSGPKLRVARHSHTATLLRDGRVLIVGGVGLKSSEIYDPVKNEFTKGPDLAVERDDHAATLLLDGRVLVSGGQDAKTLALASAEIFDPKTMKFTPTGRMREARADHQQLTLPNGRVLVVGGEFDDGEDHDRILSSIERFDPTRGTFEIVGSLTVGRDDFALVPLHDGRIAAIGGQTGEDVAVSSIELLAMPK